MFVNGTKLDLKGDRVADFNGFLPESANWGLTFAPKRLTLMAKWNYRGKQRLGAVPALGSDAFQYTKGRIFLDLNLDYQIRKNLFFFANVKNIFNVPATTLNYGSDTPHRAKEFQVRAYGALYDFGVRGTF